MFVAFSIGLIVVYFITLIYDDFYAMRLRGAELEVEKLSTNDSIRKTAITVEQGKLYLPLFMLIPILFIILPIYLGVAISHDVLKVPTLVMIAWYVIEILRGVMHIKNKPKYDNKLEKATAYLAEVQSKQHRKVYRTIASILYLLYFAYMIFILIY